MTEQTTPHQNLQQTPQQAPQQAPDQGKGTSGLAIAGLVLGVLAVAASFIPIINNGAFVIAIIGLVLAIIGRSQVKKGAKTGGGIAIAGIVLCIVAIVVTLAVQAACSAALDSATSNATGTVANSASTAASDDQGQTAGEQPEQADTANMSVGQTVDLNNGLSITVNSVEPGLVNYDDSTMAGVSVTYTNNGTSGASFNVFDWKAEDANGAQRSTAYYSEASDELNSGTLSAGGSVTGNIYFDEPVVKVVYYSNLLSSDSDIAWNVA